MSKWPSVSPTALNASREGRQLIASVERHRVHAWWVYESDFKRRIALETLMRHMFRRTSDV
jgi:hypothetical protein